MTEQEKRENVINGLECCSGDYALCSTCYLENSGTCRDTLMKDAIELLKAQEPRVMTLEEVHTSEICWYENSSNYGYYVGSIIQERFFYKLRTKYLKIGSTIVHVNYDEDYKKTWRCWDKKPTDAQRGMIPWMT